MAKKKATSAGSSTPRRRTKKPSAGGVIDMTPRDVVNRHYQREQNAKNASPTIPSGADGSTIGFPIPFVLQYLIDASVWEYGTTSEINGLKQSCKSMFCYELGRFIYPLGGWVNYCNVEGKASAELAYSVIGWSNSARKAVHFHNCENINVAQSHVFKGIELQEELATKKFKDGKNELAPFGFTFPVAYILDSVSGGNTQGQNEKIEKEGSAGKGYADEAMSLTRFFKDVSNKIPTYPAIIVFVRHRKEDPGETQWDETKVRKPGGHHLGFQASYELVLRYSGKRRELNTQPGTALTKERRTIWISNGKNSSGTNNRSCPVDVSWLKVMKEDPVSGTPRQLQYTKWHWDAALVDLIEKWLANDARVGDLISGAERKTRSVAGRSQRLAEFFHLEPTMVGKYKRYYSRTLGMSKSDAVEKTVMGQLIEADRDAIGALRLAFGLKPGHAWRADEDFHKYRQKTFAKVAADTYISLSDESIEEFSRKGHHTGDSTMTSIETYDHDKSYLDRE